MKNEYRNTQDDIGFEFEYDDEHEKSCNFEGLVFELLSFIAEYNMEEECVDHLNISPNYYLGTKFRAFYLKDYDHDMYLDEGILTKEN